MVYSSIFKTAHHIFLQISLTFAYRLDPRSGSLISVKRYCSQNSETQMKRAQSSAYVPAMLPPTLPGRVKIGNDCTSRRAPRREEKSERLLGFPVVVDVVRVGLSGF